LLAALRNARQEETDERSVSIKRLETEAKKNLAICLASVGSALALLAFGIVIGGALVIVLGTGVLVVSGFVVTRRGPAYVTYRGGMQGERVFRDHLRSLGLNDEHTAYYNFPTSGNERVSDIDCILVSPFGLFVFEVKHHRGLVFCRNGIWAQFKVGRRGNPYAGHLGDPSVQLSRNIGRLKALFRRAGLGAFWFTGAVVFTNLRAVLDIEGLRWIEAVSVKDLDRIVSKRITLSTDQVDRINTCLSASSK
jgi:hypothetical protein